MSTSNPFIPAGTLIAESQRRNRTQFKVGVYAVLAAHTMLLLGLLIQGCRSDQSATTATGDETAALATPAPSPVPISRTPRPTAPIALTVPPAAAEVPSMPEAAPMVTATSSIAESYYEVKAGDTLAKIARARGTTVKAIRDSNHLKDDRLSIGRRLVIPPRTLASASVTGK